MPTPDFSVVFHVGAHKTATTHLQSSLLSVTDELSAAGVRYYGPDHFRLPGRTLTALFGLRARRGPGREKRPAPEQLELMRKGAQRIILSEENYIGKLHNPKRGKPARSRYPNAARRVSLLAERLEQPVDICLSIRNPVSFLNSAYCQMLLAGDVMRNGRYKVLNPTSSVDWLDLVTRLRAAPGVNQLTVWAYEDYTGVFGQVAKALVGPGGADIVKPLDRRVHPGLSAHAVAAILEQGEHADPSALRKEFSVLDGHPPYDGYAPRAHMGAQRAYSEQIEKISAMDGVTFLTP